LTAGDGSPGAEGLAHARVELAAGSEGGSMRLGRKHRDYWRRNLKLTASLLAVWFVVTFVVSYFARDLAGVTLLGFPLGFYMGAQGAPVIYLLIIWWYARYMNNLDREYGVNDGEGEE
jgi:putative solute:sodium symporter small subunit